jgi:hypothetical protein
MTSAVQHLIDSFESLSDAEKRQAAVEILRRAPQDDEGLSDEDLTVIADDLFRALDAEEVDRGRS